MIVYKLIWLLQEHAEKYGYYSQIGFVDSQGVDRDDAKIVMTSISTTLEACGKETNW